VAKPIDEEVGRRHRVSGPFGNSYFFVSENDVMLTIAEENSPQHYQLRAMSEALCRVISKGLKGPLDHATVAEQLRKADSGRCKILSDLADCLVGG
jgi:hypothetical protein